MALDFVMAISFKLALRSGSRRIAIAVGEALTLPSAQVPVCEIPIDQLLDNHIRIFCTAVLVVQIVGVFPHIDDEQRYLVMDHRGVGVRGVEDPEFAVVHYQPGPTTAELPGGR